jgi:hypothetical protein
MTKSAMVRGGRPPLLEEAVLPLLIARARAEQSEADRRPSAPDTPGPVRFGDSYRWPDGTWTQSG